TRTGLSVFPLASCCKDNIASTSVTLGCLVTGYLPMSTTVTWDTGSLNKNVTTFPTTFHETYGLHSIVSQVTASGEWAKQRFTCSVAHADSSTPPATPSVIPTPPSSSCSDPRGVSSYLSPPSPLDLYVHKAPKITCLVVDLATMEGMNLTWYRESKEPVNPGPLNKKDHFNGTITVTSTLPVNTNDWIEGETYYCRVTHPHLPKDIVRSIAKAPGKRAPPDVYLFLPPEEEQGTKDRVTLTCLIQNFFPADISVQWLRNDSPIQTDQYTTTGPHKVSGSRPAFFIFSRLEVSRVDWEQKNKFTCQVVHEALSGSRILQKWVSKTPELELQELCADATESEELDELWASLLIFITLFLLSVSYGATSTLFKVKWVLATVLQEMPQAAQDYANIVRPAQ
uniref:Ig-like domain-containing protein n=1 Tax=Canis lupus dingo TaxID=286419 RepID=A0A8C0K2Q7_CANLU